MSDINLEIGENYITWSKYSESEENQHNTFQKCKIDFLLFYDPDSPVVTVGDEIKIVESIEPTQLISNMIKWINIAYDDDEFKEYIKTIELNVKDNDSIPVVEVKHNKEVVQLTINQIVIDFFKEVRIIINRMLNKDNSCSLNVILSYAYKYNRIQKSIIEKCLELSGITVEDKDNDDLINKMNNLNIKQQSQSSIRAISPLQSSSSSSSSSTTTTSNTATAVSLILQAQPYDSTNYINHNNDDNEPINIPYDNYAVRREIHTIYSNYDSSLGSILFPTFSSDEELVFNNNDNAVVNNNNDNDDNNNSNNEENNAV